MFTRTERILISVIIAAVILAVVTFFIEDPNAVSAAEEQLVIPEEIKCDLPVYNIEKFTNPPAESSCEIPPFDVTYTAKATTFYSAGGLTKSRGVFNGPSGKETWYDLDMTGVIRVMRSLGYSEEEYPYWIRDDGCKMLGDYIMIAADTKVRPKGTILETSLGIGMVCDHCVRAETEKNLIDLAVDWR